MFLPWQHFCLEWFANEKWSNQQTCLKSNTAAIFQWITFIFETIRDYVWVNFKPDHPPDDPRGFARSHCPGGQVFAQLLCPGRRGFEFEKFSAVLKEKCRNFSICFKETRGSFINKCSCAVSHHFFAKPADLHCIFYNIYHFRPFRSLSCYPSVTLLIPDHH